MAAATHPPSPTRPKEIIEATDFAPVYKSIFTSQVRSIEPEILTALKNVNCSYLSTPGIAPTLLQLKQHAHSLCVLIKLLTVNTIPGLINNEQAEIHGAPTFSDGEAYDFLNDLGKAYEGPTLDSLKAHHNMPLTALVNVLEQYSADAGTGMPTRGGGRRGLAAMSSSQVMVRDVCPLHSSHKTPKNQPSLPYATHQALIAHANEVLELLDHEYSAKGGLLAILPPKDQVEDREKAETTLLGQLILYMQRLVQRLHDLERLYANSMDALASEAVVPHQALSRLGPDGRKGREIIYPQDRFVLVNAGEDVWNFLHAEFERKEVIDRKVMENYRSQGVMGEKLWANHGGKEMARGITAVDVVTRYYRLSHDPLKTIFVIPAHSDHPGTKVTREMERQPTVVSVVKPVWPERASMWEMKRREDLEELKRLRQEHALKVHELEVKTSAEKLLMADNSVKDGTISHLMQEIAALKTILAEPENEAKRAAAEALSRTKTDRAAAQTEKTAAQTEKEKVVALRKELEAERKRLNAERDAHRLHAAEQMRKMADKKMQETKRLQEIDRSNAVTANALRDQLEKAYRDQIRETQVIVEYLRRKRFEVDSTAVPTDEDEKKGWADGDMLVDEIMGRHPKPKPPQGWKSTSNDLDGNSDSDDSEACDADSDDSMGGT